MKLISKIKELIPWRGKSVAPHEVVSQQDDINRLFDRFFASPFDATWPTADFEETDGEVIARVEVPGIDPKNLNVTVRDGMLQVKYEQREERRSGNGDSGWMERRYGSFSRSFALLYDVDTSKAEAKCAHGALTVRIPRTEEAKQKIRRIPIKA
jgi:HSP20 family protein